VRPDEEERSEKGEENKRADERRREENRREEVDEGKCGRREERRNDKGG
jgi:hypothetical protein